MSVGRSVGAVLRPLLPPRFVRLSFFFRGQYAYMYKNTSNPPSDVLLALKLSAVSVRVFQARKLFYFGLITSARNACIGIQQLFAICMCNVARDAGRRHADDFGLPCLRPAALTHGGAYEER